MIRYSANSAATRRHRPLDTGFETEAEARAQAEFLAETYGGVAMVGTNTGLVCGKYSARRGWH